MIGMNSTFKTEIIDKDLIRVDVVPSGCVGVLLVNGAIHTILKPGKYAYFTKPHSVTLKIVDTRPQILTVNGQELLTRDKVPLRLSFVATFRIADPLRSVQAVERLDEAVYLRVQLALRGLISAKTLDELLSEKQEVGSFILNDLRQHESELGLVYEHAGIKDIILPGEIKDILNTILIAEKRAMANVIARREETASTRSLMNTAKLMDENATLYRLKELETLERLFDKVGTISLSSNSGLLDQLSGLLKPKP
jgi:regulator of protease activity HflC (stomatin/prohibitin superfamily)